MRPRQWPRLVEAFVIGFLAVMLVSEAILFLPGAHPRLSAQVTIQADGNAYFINTTFTSPYSANLAETYLWEPSGAPRWHLYYYYDPAYASLADIFDWYYLPGHLSTVEGYRSADTALTDLNTTGLASFLAAPPVRGDVLLMDPGFLPVSIAGASGNLLETWVRAGGSLLWVGGLLGYYVATSTGERSSTTPATDAGWNGTSRFLPTSWVLGAGLPPASGGNPRNLTPVPTGLPGAFAQPSALASAFAIDFPSVDPGALFNTSRLPGTNGSGGTYVLGYQFGSWTNVLRLPLGNGTVVDFAGPILDSNPFSISVVNLLQSGLLTEPARILASSQLLVAAGSTSTSAELLLPPGLGPGGSLCVLDLQSDFDMPFGAVTCSS